MVAANTLVDIPAEATLVAAGVTPAAAAEVTAKNKRQARQQGPLLERAFLFARSYDGHE
jgi:hypothetical protein